MRQRRRALNLRTRIYRHFDSAGVATNARLDANGNPIEAYDFKGNLLRSTRRLVSDYTAIPDWSAEPATRRRDLREQHPLRRAQPPDPVDRAAQQPGPRSTAVNVIQPVFNEANLLERVDVWLERAAEPAALLDPATDAPSPVGVANIDYDAKGQRQRIDYKNGASTIYDYDPLTFRLTHLLHPARRGRLPRRLTRSRRHRRLAAASQAAEPALHLRPGRQHHPHPGRRAADHLLQEPARRAEQRLHLRRPLPADPGHRPRAPGPDRRRADPALVQRCRRVGVSCHRRHRAERRQRHGHVHRALRVRRRRQLPADAAPRQRPGASRLDARLRLRRSQPDRSRASRATA